MEITITDHATADGGILVAEKSIKKFYVMKADRIPVDDSGTVPVAPLPAVMHGVDGVVEVLGASETFVRTWMDMPLGGEVPAMPSYQLMGNRVFPTGRVLAWLDEFFLYGAGGRPVSQRPPERRGVGRRKGKKDLATKGTE